MYLLVVILCVVIGKYTRGVVVVVIYDVMDR